MTQSSAMAGTSGGLRRTPMSMTLRRRELLLAAGLCVVFRGAAAAPIAPARRLRLNNVHTGETFEGPYRDAAGPIPAGMEGLARLLRHHHVCNVGPLDCSTLDFLPDVMSPKQLADA